MYMYSLTQGWDPVAPVKLTTGTQDSRFSFFIPIPHFCSTPQYYLISADCSDPYTVKVGHIIRNYLRNRWFVGKSAGTGPDNQLKGFLFDSQRFTLIMPIGIAARRNPEIWYIISKKDTRWIKRTQNTTFRFIYGLRWYSRVLLRVKICSVQ